MVRPGRFTALHHALLVEGTRVRRYHNPLQIGGLDVRRVMLTRLSVELCAYVFDVWKDPEEAMFFSIVKKMTRSMSGTSVRWSTRC